jgi:hypothetical protein
VSAPTSTRADRLGGAVWVTLGLAMLAGAWRMDRFESMGATLYTAPGLVPGVYGLLLASLGGVLLWRSRRAAASSEPLLNRRIVLTLLLTLAYAAVAIGRLPFALSTAVFVALFCALFDDREVTALRRWLTAVVAGAATALVVVLVFERVFLVRLP